MSDSLYRRLVAHERLVLFGRLFPDALSASALLVPLGADMARLPPFGALPPAQWWFGALTEIDRGAFGFGLEAVVAAAANWFPGEGSLAALVRPAEAGGAGAQAGTRPSADEKQGAQIRVLMLLASPTDESRLRLEEEQRVLRELSGSQRLVTTVVTATRVTDIIPALLAARPEIVHFSGHGTADGRLIFEDASGYGVPVDAEAVAKVFTATGDLTCIVLNSCYTGAYADVLGESADTVVGSTEPLGDKCAIAFTRGFYQALVAGRDVGAAYPIALAEMGLTGCPTHHMRIRTRAGNGEA